MYVLVYMNGCGPCDNYKKSYWNNIISAPGMRNRTASVHYDQLPHTSLNGVKHQGYPSVIEVKNGVPVMRNDENGQVTNAMAAEEMRSGLNNIALNTPSPSPFSPSPSPFSPSPIPVSPSPNPFSPSLASTANLSLPLNGSQIPAGDSLLNANHTSRTPQVGGSLLESMLTIAKDPGVLTAALLTLTASGVISMNKKRKTRRRQN